jgi:hypothetical protein
MSTDVFSVYDDNGARLTLTRFSRGTARGIGYQLTIDSETGAAYVQFSPDELRRIAESLTRALLPRSVAG